MTSAEREILGVNDVKEAETLRDIVMTLCGAFQEHVRTEELWQERIEKALSKMPDMMDEKIDACHDKDKEVVQETIDWVQAEQVKSMFLKGQGKVAAGVVAAAAAITTTILALIHMFTD